MNQGMAYALRGQSQSSETVWLVGEYDDYLAAVFSTEPAAQEFLALKETETGSGGWWISVLPLNPKVP